MNGERRTCKRYWCKHSTFRMGHEQGNRFGEHRACSCVTTGGGEAKGASNARCGSRNDEDRSRYRAQHEQMSAVGQASS